MVSRIEFPQPGRSDRSIDRGLQQYWAGMETLPLRLAPDADLRRALESAVATHQCRAAFVVSGIGSLRAARLRLAGAIEPLTLDDDLEVLTLVGTISPEGSHLHVSVANSEGRVFGGHVSYGCTVRTTAEVLMLLLPEWSFTRQLDPATGFCELVIRSES